jgi:two-component system sensor histidine kinase TctE
LATQTRNRDAEDIRPLQSDHLPADVRPLVEAVNQQLSRIETLMAQRRSFVDDASHQLRTPLTILRAQMDFILRETDTPKREEALLALSDALGQAIRGTNQLLTLARSDAGGLIKEPFDLVALTRQVALELLPVARERGIDFGVDGPETPLISMGDPSLIKQALLNIAHNALVHGKAQGVVTLTPGQDATNYFLKVVDDGAGMDPDVFKQMGQRFAKGRGSRGSGLGMAIASSVMQSHNGQLTAVAVGAEQGMCITLWWPVCVN